MPVPLKEHGCDLFRNGCDRSKRTCAYSNTPVDWSCSFNTPVDWGRVPSTPPWIGRVRPRERSSRFSSRNRTMAEFRHGHDLGTLLRDLLTRDEEDVDIHTRQYRFDIDHLAARVVVVTYSRPLASGTVRG